VDVSFSLDDKHVHSDGEIDKTIKSKWIRNRQRGGLETVGSRGRNPRRNL
jgi:hypothetical protein